MRATVSDRVKVFYARVDVQYYWMCPEVTCHPISADCETVEYIVFQYDYMVRGRLVNVRCESCEYCLDGPFSKSTPGRQKRSDVIASPSSASVAASSAQVLRRDLLVIMLFDS